VFISEFDAFKAELQALQAGMGELHQKTLRDELVRERFRTLFRTWTSIVYPAIKNSLQSKRELLKLDAEVEALAKLTTRIKPVSDYRKRLARSIEFVNGLVLYLPLREPKIVISGEEVFTPLIPDLPVRFVPNAILGWRGRLEDFLQKHPFDQSVFIMIRYRNRNNKLIGCIKKILAKRGYFGVLASEHNLTDDLYNSIACLFCCSKGLAIFDKPELSQDFNPNVAYELGMMHLLSRECKILKHSQINVLHTDILMKLYLAYSTINDVKQHLISWLTPTE
jgi:hypothetical protein